MLDSRFRLPYGSGQSEIPTRAVPFARPDYRKGAHHRYRLTHARRHGVAFKLDAHTHFAARVRSADIEETPLNSSHRRRRTKAKEEVTRGSRKLKPITPPLKGK